MQISIFHRRTIVFQRVTIAVAAALGSVLMATAAWADTTSPSDQAVDQRVVTIYDQGKKRVVLTKADTVAQTLAQAGVEVAAHDRVEPALSTRYAANNYTVNIYRAYPVTIVDGMKRQQILTPYTAAKDIASDAGIAVRSEDRLTLTRSSDVLADGIGTVLTIERATPVTLVLYGARSQVYTQQRSVAEFLTEKKITLAASDTISVDKTAAITSGMTIEVWRDGVQTVTSEEPIDFTRRTVLDADQPVGYRAVRTAGVPGKKSVVYEINRQQGRELSRTVIQSVVVEQPKEQIEVLGNKPKNPLTKSKGAQQFTDSKGVTHRETYYDLPMNVTMGSCGGGDYTVRADGAKVDRDGYILVAANLGNYPRCSIVETSMGLGRVYDTGGFAVRHPHGFDLATDWTNGDGR